MTLAEHAQDQILLDRERLEDLAALRHIGDAEIADLERPQPDELALPEADGSRADRNVAHDRAEQGRLAHAVATHQGDDLALRYVQRECAQDLAAGLVAGDQVADRQHARGLTEIGRAHRRVALDF